MAGKSIRLGGGAGYETDWIEPARILAEHGELDYLCFETLAERTLAMAQRRRLANPEAGYNPTLSARMQACLPACARQGVKIIGNFGAANPLAAAGVVAETALDLAISGLNIATITGDDVRDVLPDTAQVWETGGTIADLPGEIIAANAYLGAGPIVAALDEGADVVITGRVADPALFLAPMIHEFAWGMQDWNRLGQGIAIGHLLECSAYVTGGNFWDPGVSPAVPNLHEIGFPIGEVSADGTAVIAKVAGTGGLISAMTCKTQLCYEIGDPGRYLTPDVCADFTQVEVREVGADRVHVSGGLGRARIDTLKVSVACMDGFIGEAEFAWGGPGALAKAQATADTAEALLGPLRNAFLDYRVDYVGVNSIFGPAAPALEQEPNEVRLRIAARTRTRDDAARVARLSGDLGMVAPLGAGAARADVRPVVGMYSTLLDRAAVRTQIHWS